MLRCDLTSDVPNSYSTPGSQHRLGWTSQLVQQGGLTRQDVGTPRSTRFSMEDSSSTLDAGRAVTAAASPRATARDETSMTIENPKTRDGPDAKERVERSWPSRVLLSTRRSRAQIKVENPFRSRVACKRRHQVLSHGLNCTRKDSRSTLFRGLHRNSMSGIILSSMGMISRAYVEID